MPSSPTTFKASSGKAPFEILYGRKCRTPLNLSETCERQLLGNDLTRVLMDGGSTLNLLYQDTVRKMGINPSQIKPTKTTFKGVILGVEARCTGSITLEVSSDLRTTSEARS